MKTNLGHLETAAGIAGLVKAVLVLKHGQVPANLHFANAQSEHRLQWIEAARELHARTIPGDQRHAQWWV